MGDPHFNPHLQTFLWAGLPGPYKDAQVMTTPATPLDLNALLGGGDFYEYAGSETAPPCTEATTWLVRTAPLLASDWQISDFVAGVLATNSGFGNNRATMPMVMREVRVVGSADGNALGTQWGAFGKPDLKEDLEVTTTHYTPRTKEENDAIKQAANAVTEAKYVKKYVEDMDARLLTSTTTMPPTTTAFDLAGANNARVANAIAQAAQSAIDSATQAIKNVGDSGALEAAKNAVESAVSGDHLPPGQSVPRLASNPVKVGVQHLTAASVIGAAETAIDELHTSFLSLTEEANRM